jgi:hypothetical protein
VGACLLWVEEMGGRENVGPRAGESCSPIRVNIWLLKCGNVVMVSSKDMAVVELCIEAFVEVLLPYFEVTSTSTLGAFPVYC